MKNNNGSIRQVNKYGAMALLSLSATVGLSMLAPKAIAQENQLTIVTLEQLCEPLPEADEFQCQIDESIRLNQAKNYARQRGERENGGVSTIEVETSMHGPAVESPYVLAVGEDTIQYTFTFRIRPRGGSFYTTESQVAAIYNRAENLWSFNTIYNRAIEPTAVSYSEAIADEI